MDFQVLLRFDAQAVEEGLQTVGRLGFAMHGYCSG
jgi:hypothetical protein